MSLRSFLFWVALPSLLAAQEPAKQDEGKRQPSSRPLGAQQDQRKEQPLPAIDLPEFVITGAASINPPDARKNQLEESGMYHRNAAENTTGTRDRESVDLGERFKQGLFLSEKWTGGFMRAAMGNFFTPEIQAMASLADPAYDLAGSVYYRRTKGFTRYADASGGKIGLAGSHELQTGSPSFRNLRLGAGASFEVQSYKFFGSLRPSTERSLSGFDLKIHAAADFDTDLSGRSGLLFQSFNMQDSSTTTTENGFAAEIAGSVPVYDIPIAVRARGSFLTISSLSSQDISLVSLSMAFPVVRWGDVSLRMSAEGYRVTGMNGQEGSYLFPQLFVRIPFLPAHAAFASFEPSVDFRMLRSSVEKNPYISANTSIRHTINKLTVLGGWESAWTPWLTTKFWVEHRSMTNYPLYVDSASSGVWNFMYGGITTLTAFHAYAVANIGSNDYFAMSAETRDTRNTLVFRVPYVPALELSALWLHRFDFAVNVSPTLGFVGSRHADMTGTARMESSVRAGVKVEYVGIRDLMLFAEATNLANERFEIWRGYRAEPLRVGLGLSYRW